MFKKISLYLLIICFALGGINISFAQDTEEVELYSKLVAFMPIDDEVREIEVPLKHTSVKANVAGYITKVEVEQEYENNFEEAIEAMYLFPLPENAAIHSMEMIIGDTVVRGVIKEREEARKIYEQAKQDGKRTSLLDQERPNIFTQSVANIMPGDKIIIKISYIETLNYDNGEYTFRFPMVVGHRYEAGEKIIDEVVEPHFDGEMPMSNEDEVLEEAIVNTRTKRSVNPTILPPNTRSGHDIDLSLNIDTENIRIKDINSNSHDIAIETKSDFAANIQLNQADSIPNKDFVLTYKVAGERAESAVLTSKESGEDGYFTLMIQPPNQVAKDSILPKEIIFIVDVSGSMRGTPIEMVRKAMEYSVLNLNPKDTFNLYFFANDLLKYKDEAIIASDKNIDEAVKYIRAIQSGGGTNMMPAVQAAVEAELPEGKLRIISMMTDGGIGNDDEVIELIQNTKSDQIRWFPFSVGPSGNHYLLDRMADLGRGKSFYVGNNDDPEKVVDDFYARIDAPIFVNLDIDWDGLKVYDIYPKELPDLFAGEPLYLHGRYKNSGNFDIKLKGLVASMEESIFKKNIAKEDEIVTKVSFPKATSEESGISSVWARKKIEELMNELRVSRADEKIKQEIIDTAIKYSLMSNYTSFVAVEEKVVNEDGELKTIEVPVEIPEGTVHPDVMDGVMTERAMPNTGGGWSQHMSGADTTSWGASAGYVQSSTGLGNDDPRSIYANIINLILGIIGIFSLILFVLGIIKIIIAKRIKIEGADYSELNMSEIDEQEAKKDRKAMKVRFAKRLIISSLILLVVVLISFASASYVLDYYFQNGGFTFLK